MSSGSLPPPTGAPVPSVPPEPVAPVATAAATPATQVAPAGWYPDPSGGWRWFDGIAWGPVWQPASERPALPTLRLSDAVWALVILAASLVAGRFVVDAIADGTPVLVQALVSGFVGYAPSVAWCMHVLRREGTGPTHVLGLRFRWPDLGWGPVTYLAAIAVEVGLALVIRLIGVPFESNVSETTAADRTAGYVIGLVVTAVIAAPIVEELVFRGVVLRGLASRLGVIGAVAVQAVLFGCAHIDPARGWGNAGLAVALSGVGAALGVTAVLTRRLGAPMIAHAILNGVVLAVVLSGALDNV